LSAKKQKFDVFDLLIVAGLAVFAWGVYEQFGRPVALMVSGGVFAVVGLAAATKTTTKIPTGRNRQ
jgi:uncharacterized membrane protein